jgi:hypothetical protein
LGSQTQKYGNEKATANLTDYNFQVGFDLPIGKTSAAFSTGLGYFGQVAKAKDSNPVEKQKYGGFGLSVGVIVAIPPSK